MIINGTNKRSLSAAAYKISRPQPVWIPVFIRKSLTGQIKAIQPRRSAHV